MTYVFAHRLVNVMLLQHYIITLQTAPIAMYIKFCVVALSSFAHLFLYLSSLFSLAFSLSFNTALIQRPLERCYSINLSVRMYCKRTTPHVIPGPANKREMYVIRAGLERVHN